MSSKQPSSLLVVPDSANDLIIATTVVRALIEPASAVQRLVLSGGLNNNEGLSILCQALQQTTTLLVLVISGPVASRTLAKLQRDGISRNTSLISFLLDISIVSGPEAIRLAMELQSHATLKFLAIGRSLAADFQRQPELVLMARKWLQQDDQHDVSTNNSCNRGLVVLFLVNCDMEPAGAATLGGHLMGSGGLPLSDSEFFVAASNHSSDSRQFAAGGSSLAYSLRALSLRNNPRISNEGATSLAVLGMSSCIKELDVVDCGIGDDGAGSLGDALRSNKTLRSLHLAKNGHITKRGLRLLVEGLASNTTLTELTLVEPAGANAAKRSQSRRRSNSNSPPVAIPIFGSQRKEIVKRIERYLETNRMLRSSNKLVTTPLRNNKQSNAALNANERAEHFRPAAKNSNRLSLHRRRQKKGLTVIVPPLYEIWPPPLAPPRADDTTVSNDFDIIATTAAAARATSDCSSSTTQGGLTFATGSF